MPLDHIYGTFAYKFFCLIVSTLVSLFLNLLFLLAFRFVAIDVLIFFFFWAFADICARRANVKSRKFVGRIIIITCYLIHLDGCRNACGRGISCQIYEFELKIYIRI